MNARRRRIPTWMLTTFAGVCIFWCVLALFISFAPAADTRRPLVLATFVHESSAGPIPWRAVLLGPTGESQEPLTPSPGEVRAVLAWKRPSNLGLGVPIFRKRRMLDLWGDPPEGVAPLSVADAQSLLQSAFATLPPNAEAGQINARNAFLDAIAPTGAFAGVDRDAVLFWLSVSLAACGATCSMRTLRGRNRASVEALRNLEAAPRP